MNTIKVEGGGSFKKYQKGRPNSVLVCCVEHVLMIVQLWAEQMFL